MLLLFVLWQAFKERLATEEQDPDTTLAGHVTLLQNLVKGATQAEKEYKEALKRAKGNIAEGGPTGPWTADPSLRASALSPPLGIPAIDIS